MAGGNQVISEHIKGAIIALINVDTGATETERERVRLALTDARPNGRTIRIRDAAKILGIHRNTIKNWVDAGRLQAVLGPTGKVVGITEASLATA
jgi:excisionase family DNA binding protein